MSNPLVHVLFSGMRHMQNCIQAPPRLTIASLDIVGIHVSKEIMPQIEKKMINDNNWRRVYGMFSVMHELIQIMITQLQYPDSWHLAVFIHLKKRRWREFSISSEYLTTREFKLINRIFEKFEGILIKVLTMDIFKTRKVEVSKLAYSKYHTFVQAAVFFYDNYEEFSKIFANMDEAEQSICGDLAIALECAKTNKAVVVPEEIKQKVVYSLN